jgi:S-adenosylmethionine decarboxylase
MNVVNEAWHQFTPVGTTGVYVLAESHMSIHTYPEYGKCYMDIFSCDLNLDTNAAFQTIKDYFKTDKLDAKVLFR